VAPEPEESAFAAEGTVAHALFADALLRGVSPLSLTGDETLAMPLELAVQLARNILTGRRFRVEARLPPLPGLPQIWGTSDVLVFDRFGRVAAIIDLKFGRRPVEADAIQLQIYALLAAQKYGAPPEGVTAHIIQPRCLHVLGPTRAHHHSVASLDQLLVDLCQAVQAATDVAAPHIAGPWCRFCPVEHVCEARQQLPEPSRLGRSAWLTTGAQFHAHT
jgi:hypothetical protein